MERLDKYASCFSVVKQGTLIQIDYTGVLVSIGREVQYHPHLN